MMTRSQSTPASSQIITLTRMLEEKDAEIERLRAELEATKQQKPAFWGPRMAILNQWDSLTVRLAPARETDIPLYLAAGAQAAVPDGWQLVPIEPTPEMLARTSAPGCAKADWEKMIAAVVPKSEGA